MKKKKVLCICALGRNRSKYLASYLKNKGYITRFGDVELSEEEVGELSATGVPSKLLKQEDVDWADVIILVRKRLEPIFRKKFNIRGKKFIVFDVTDSQRIVSSKHPKFEGLDYLNFQKKWTRPQLRKTIKKYLPL